MFLPYISSVKLLQFLQFLASIFFACFMDLDSVQVQEHAKQERDQYPAILTYHAWSITNIYFFLKHLSGPES